MEKGFNNIPKSLDMNNDVENNEKLKLNTELAGGKDWEDFKKIRLEAIENEPMAFYVTKSIKEKEINKSEEEWKKELKDANSFVILSKDKDIPIGMTQALLKLN